MSDSLNFNFNSILDIILQYVFIGVSTKFEQAAS